jgi:hypothetical protein
MKTLKPVINHFTETFHQRCEQTKDSYFLSGVTVKIPAFSLCCTLSVGSSKESVLVACQVHGTYFYAWIAPEYLDPVSLDLLLSTNTEE